MKLISPEKHKALLRAAERTRQKYQNQLLTKRVPVSARILRELGVSIKAESQKVLAEIDQAAPAKNTSADVAEVVLFADYYEKLQAYRPNAATAPASAADSDSTPESSKKK